MTRFSLRRLRLSVLCVAASFAIYGASCRSEPAPAGTGGGAGGPFADVIFEGKANDEALEALLSAMPVPSPPKYAIFDAPEDGAALPSSPIPTFTWHVTTAGADGGARAPERPASRWALGDAWSKHESRSAALGPLLDLFGGERVASAHGAPLNGIAYFVVFEKFETTIELLRVFTTSTTYTPDEAAWSKLTSVGSPISAWIMIGVFDDNHLASDGGPFRGPWIGLTVEP